MNTKIEDYIYGIAEFNSCDFCKKFGASAECPVRNAYAGYNESKEPSGEVIESNAVLCKTHVLQSLRTLL